MIKDNFCDRCSSVLLLTTSPNFNPQGKTFFKKRKTTSGGKMRNLEKGPQMGESPPFQDDHAEMDAEWATFDTILLYTMLVRIS